MSSKHQFIEYLGSQFGTLEICADNNGITSIAFVSDRSKLTNSSFNTQQAAAQLREYFAGNRTQFELQLAPQGTPFQQLVWQQLTTIAYGQTCSYGDIAKAINNPKAVRAVGAANGRNPLTIVVPCHRVIGSNGSLTGYAWGTAIKAGLLALENTLTLDH
ncbi:methylated-DNA--[protein]-cysteine S-methyltransferase [uncultured Paraglaciecola sp.]|uniref:methylated-DNA--[protein]-cysteine S-methyltransferase n=1 Tax=uncultured Paraglaciecola sp. TaxID=1765024 RepID=UPI0026262842|nr:methylated-DNA--[protein]-cysteine S-methyltransferase [uncultured Paraglaciecola sp.]